MDTLQKLGLTPIYVRLAAKYLEKGVGTYPCDSFGYDEVRVSVERGWNNYARKGDPPAYFMEFRVEFYADEKRKKWVEFKASMVGGGSSNLAFNVITNDEEDNEHSD